ncbi:unnamed protein product [Pleuronectes platessa]|uniref:Uncharacterized protein n=1 Tax=Pleuronectes platessa TaxID=8262 RepID=A0A9N7USF5_PLEPL|nr:unnamed protein product [Pleuronectes platessa]
MGVIEVLRNEGGHSGLELPHQLKWVWEKRDGSRVECMNLVSWSCHGANGGSGAEGQKSSAPVWKINDGGATERQTDGCTDRQMYRQMYGQTETLRNWPYLTDSKISERGCGGGGSANSWSAHRLSLHFLFNHRSLRDILPSIYHTQKKSRCSLSLRDEGLRSAERQTAGLPLIHLAGGGFGLRQSGQPADLWVRAPVALGRQPARASTGARMTEAIGL